MECFIFFVILSFAHNSLFSAEPLSQFFSFSNTQEVQLKVYLEKLPSEIQKRIYCMALDNLKKYNIETIKTYIYGFKIDAFKQQWYDIQYYFSFKNYGSVCTNIIAFYPKKNIPFDHGVEQSAWGNKVIGSFAVVFIHTLQESGNIHTTDYLEKKYQEDAPHVLNAIKLGEKDPGKVYWLNKNENRHVIVPTENQCTLM